MRTFSFKVLICTKHNVSTLHTKDLYCSVKPCFAMTTVMVNWEISTISAWTSSCVCQLLYIFSFRSDNAKVLAYFSLLTIVICYPCDQVCEALYSWKSSRASVSYQTKWNKRVLLFH